VQEENSSSPRDSRIDKITVVELTKRSVFGNGYEVVFSDGTSLFLLQDVVFRYGVREGGEFTRDEVNRLQEESFYIGCERKAFDLLSRSSYSSSRLRLKLLDRGFPERVVDKTVKRMGELGYIDDEKFAENWIEFRVRRHPEGRIALIAGLVDRGIDRWLAEEKVNEFFSRESEEKIAERAYEKLMERMFRDVSRKGKGLHDLERKFYSRLSRLGFSHSIVMRLIERYRGEIKRRENS